MGSGMRDRGVWWGGLRGMFVCLFVCLFEFAARAKKKKKITAERMIFLTHTSYMKSRFFAAAWKTPQTADIAATRQTCSNNLHLLARNLPERFSRDILELTECLDSIFQKSPHGSHTWRFMRDEFPR